MPQWRTRDRLRRPLTLVAALGVGLTSAIAGVVPAAQAQATTVTETSINTAGTASGPYQFPSSPEGGSVVGLDTLPDHADRESGLEFRVGDRTDADITWRLDDIIGSTDVPDAEVVGSSITLSSIDSKTWTMAARVFDQTGTQVPPEKVDVEFEAHDAPAARMTYASTVQEDGRVRISIADSESADAKGRTDHSTEVTITVSDGLIGGVQFGQFQDLSWSSDAVHLEAQRILEVRQDRAEPTTGPTAEPDAEATSQSDSDTGTPEQATTEECPAPGEGSTVEMTFNPPTYPAGGPADAVFANAGEYEGTGFDVVVTAVSGTFLDGQGHHFRATAEGTLQVMLWDPNDVSSGSSGHLAYNLAFYESGTYLSGNPVPMTVEATVFVDDFDYVNNANHERLLIDPDASVARTDPTDIRFIDGNDHFVRSIDRDDTQGGDRKNAVQIGMNGSSFDYTYVRRGSIGFQTQMTGNTDYFAGQNTTCNPGTPQPLMDIVKTVDVDQALPGDTVDYTITATNTGQADYTDIEISDDLTGILDDAVYNADGGATAGAVSFAEPTLTWTGDLPVGESVEITYSVTVNDPLTGDNIMDNTVTGPPSSPCPDNAERCSTSTPIKAMDIVKTSDADEVGPGDTVTYTITATNIGEVDYTGTEISDDLTGILDDAVYNADGGATAGAVSYAEPTLTWTGDLPVGESVEITYSVTVDDPLTGDKILANLVTGPPGGPCPQDEERCTTEDPIREMDIVKTSDADEVGPGDTVTYTITATNTGEADYTGTEITDDLTEILDDAVYNGDGEVNQGAVSYAEPTLTWTGDLLVGEILTITYSVTVNDPLTGDNIMDNVVAGPPGGPCPQDDEKCTTSGPIKDLGIEKTADTDEVLPGESVTYTVTLTNNGEVDYTGIGISDDLTGILDDAVYNADGGATAGAVSYAEPTLTWTGDVLVGESVEITYSVTVNDPLTGDKILVNAVTDENGEVCPADEPTCGTTTPVKAMDIVKSNDAGEVLPGDTVTYTVTATNIGEVDYTGTEISDDLTGILDDAVYNADGGATAGAVSFAEPTLTWTGDLAVGESVEITYSVTVNDPLTGDNIMDNTVTGPPGGPCPQDEEKCTTEDPIKGLDILKTADSEEVLPGDTVTYTVTATNIGEVDYTGTEISDDLTGVLDDAVYNDDAAADSGSASYEEPTLTWTGDLPVGESVEITYSVIVNDPLTGDKNLENAVTGPPGGPCPQDEEKCRSIVPVRALDLVKTADSEEVLPGGTVTYTVTATNIGEVDYTGTEISDDLTGVLDDAVYNDDASATAGDVSYSEPTLTWTGDLPVGESVSITYSVAVNNPLTGDNVLDNAVTGPPGGPCPQDEEQCSPDVPVKAMDIVKSNDTDEIGPGDTVTYTVTATNIGEADYIATEISDDLTGILDDAVYNGDGEANQGAVSYAEPNLTWTGDLLVGEILTVTYSVTVNDPLTGDNIMDNTVTGPPGGPCPEDQEQCTTEDPIRALDIVKSVDVQIAGPGETARYSIVAENIGEVDYTGAEISDDLTGVLDDAVYNDDAAADSGSVSYEEPTLTWTGDLPVGATVTITYSVTVGNPLPAGDGVMLNVVSGPPGGPCPQDREQCATEVPTPKYDFGDAPDSYHTMLANDGAYHQITDSLKIGAMTDSETDGSPSEVADAHADDDGLMEVRGLYEGSTHIEVDVQVTNDGESEAILAAWPDIDGNREHQVKYLRFVEIPAGSGTEVHTFTWDLETGVPAGEAHLRLRLFGALPGGMEPKPMGDAAEAETAIEKALTEQAAMTMEQGEQESSPIAFGGAGEVEDHYRTVGAPRDQPAALAATGTSLGPVLALSGALVAIGASMVIAVIIRQRRKEGSSLD